MLEEDRVATAPPARAADNTQHGPVIYLGTPSQAIVFAALLVLFSFIAVLYFVNLLRWSQEPDFGWAIVHQAGRTQVAEAFGEAARAGLEKGDRIIAVNGREISSFTQLRRQLDRQVPGQNVYEVKRNNQRLGITVANRPLGFAGAFQRFGLTWVLGITFFVMGAVVYVMKPATHASWAFLIATFNASLWINFTFTSQLWPAWLDAVLIYAQAFVPASILHLAQTFPVDRASTAASRKLTLGIPYGVSLVLFLAMLAASPHQADLPVVWKLVGGFYLAFSFAVFLLLIMLTYLRPPSAIAHTRAMVVLFGTAAATVVPITNLLTTVLAQRLLIPHPVLNVAFYVFFPLSIAYAIVRHNLFDADIYIKRTVGYGIMTAAVAGGYFGLETGTTKLLLEPLLGEQARQAFPVVFALLVVFLFNPVNRRVQTTVDKVFFRKAFDYKEAVRAVERTLTSVLDLPEIITRIIQSAREQMFIDCAGVIVLSPNPRGNLSFFMAGGERSEVQDRSREAGITPSDPLIGVLSKEKNFITKHDIDEDPRYRDIREPCRQRFQKWGASIAMPLLFHDEVIGVLIVGYKKSGRFYNRADIELLETLAAHGAVAIENAQLAERMRQEEVMRNNLSRYASPQVVEQILSGNRELNLGGQRKLVTVLFSDIRGFTGITGTRPPDQLMRILHGYFSEMNDIIFQHQGSVEQYVGDAIMAVFGSLIELENAAQNAVWAAIEMMEKMPVLSARWEQEYGFTLATGVGVATGNVLFGNIGSRERMELAVIGETVILASRFSGLAKAGQILVDKQTADYLAPPIRFNALPPTPVKGRSDEVDVFEILYRKSGARYS